MFAIPCTRRGGAFAGDEENRAIRLRQHCFGDVAEKQRVTGAAIDAHDDQRMTAATRLPQNGGLGIVVSARRRPQGDIETFGSLDCVLEDRLRLATAAGATFLA